MYQPESQFPVPAAQKMAQAKILFLMTNQNLEIVNWPLPFVKNLKQEQVPRRKKSLSTL